MADVFDHVGRPKKLILRTGRHVHPMNTQYVWRLRRENLLSDKDLVCPPYRQGVVLAPDEPALQVTGVRVREIWLEAPLGKDWIAAYRLVLQDGQAVIAEVRVFPAEPQPRRPGPGQWSGECLGIKADAPPGGLMARLLRQVHVGVVLSSLGEILKGIRNELGEEVFQPDRWYGRFGLIPQAKPHHRQGRPARPDKPLIVLAQAYAKQIERRSQHPIADLAARFHLPLSAVRSMIHAARQRGLLSPGHQGRRGGVLTPRAEMILQQGRKIKRR